jgi:hypothetical protein
MKLEYKQRVYTNTRIHPFDMCYSIYHLIGNAYTL